MNKINFLKSICLLAGCLLFLSFFACEKDDDTTTIRGNWELIEVTASGQMNAASSLSPHPDSLFIFNFSYTGDEYDAILNFNESTNEHLESGSYTQNWIIDSVGIISHKMIPNQLYDDRTWYIKGDTLFFNEAFRDDIPVEIITLNKSTLAIKEPIDYYQIGFSYPYIAHFTGTENRTYTRVD